MSSPSHARNPVYSLAAIVFLVLFAGSLIVRFWADHAAARYTGPTHVIADDSQVLVFAADSLYQLALSGELLNTISLEEAGLPGYPIDLRLDSGNVLLVASQRPAQVFACDMENWSCRPLDFAADTGPERQFKVLRNTHGFDWLYTDARGDGLWGQRIGETSPRSLLAEGQLAGPNDLLFDPEGHLWIADTDHRRIVELIPGDNGDLQEGRMHSAIHSFTREQNHYPMMLALGADGNLWLTQASRFSDGLADVTVYHPDQGAIARIELPGSQFATDITSLQDDILVTDLDAYRLYRVNTASRTVELFGDAAFQAAMAELDAARSRHLQSSNTAMSLVIVSGVLMILFAIRATPKNRRWTTAPAPLDLTARESGSPEVKGIHWLERTSRFERQVRWAPRIMWALTALSLLGLAAAYIWIQPLLQDGLENAAVDYKTRLDLLFLLMVLIMALSLPPLLQQTKAWKIKLGSDGKTLHVRLPDGRELRAQPGEVVRTRQAILYRRFSFPMLFGKNKPCYKEGELETWVAPLLHGATELNFLQALKYQWKHQNPLLLASLLCVLGWAVLIFLAMRLLP